MISSSGLSWMVARSALPSVMRHPSRCSSPSAVSDPQPNHFASPDPPERHDFAGSHVSSAGAALPICATRLYGSTRGE
jgi:hypothetical protein